MKLDGEAAITYEAGGIPDSRPADKVTFSQPFNDCTIAGVRSTHVLELITVWIFIFEKLKFRHCTVPKIKKLKMHFIAT